MFGDSEGASRMHSVLGWESANGRQVSQVCFSPFSQGGQLPGKSQLGSAHFSRAASMEQDSWSCGTGTRQLMGLSSGGCFQSHLPLLLAPTNPKASKETDRGEGINPCVPTTHSTTIQPRKRKRFWRGAARETVTRSKSPPLAAYCLWGGGWKQPEQGQSGGSCIRLEPKVGKEEWQAGIQKPRVPANMLDLGRCLTCYMGSCHSLGCLSTLPCSTASYFRAFSFAGNLMAPHGLSVHLLSLGNQASQAWLQLTSQSYLPSIHTNSWVLSGSLLSKPFTHWLFQIPFFF